MDYHFRDFIELLFPSLVDKIDWDQGYTFLDNELQKITREAKGSKLYADKLVQVYLKNGNAAYVMIHVEFQNQKQQSFPHRMLVYNCRISDMYQVPVISLAVLGDTHRHWRPNTVTRGMWECQHTFTFPIAKLADYRDRWEELEASDNPFAAVIMAHLKTQDTRRNVDERRRWKVLLVRQLYKKGYTTEAVIRLIRFL